MMNINELRNNIKNILENKKALDIEEVCVKGKTIISDYFIIASGTSTTQVKFLAEHLEYELLKLGIRANRIEGLKNANWVVMDYGDVIVHIFLIGEREKYSLQELWSEFIN